MSLQNRVTPFGEIVATPACGLMMGNRGGRLHTKPRVLGRARWRSRQWICCRLAFKNRHRQVMAPNSYTELFFLDEATALAAGHRPCAECRRAEFNAFRRAWPGGTSGNIRAADMDTILHTQRWAVVGDTQRPKIHSADMPEGAMVAIAGHAWLVTRGGLRQWSISGYGEARDHGPDVKLLTPPATVAILRAGYQPGLHPSYGPIKTVKTNKSNKRNTP
ncbi:MAG: hypothetical protein ACC634_00105 [Hyphomicrobiales bacterium]